MNNYLRVGWWHHSVAYKMELKIQLSKLNISENTF